MDGVVIKFNKHGALVSIEEGVAGLVHVSEFSTEQKLRETLELGKTYKFKITFFEPKDQKMTLSYAEADKKKRSSRLRCDFMSTERPLRDVLEHIQKVYRTCKVEVRFHEHRKTF